jgi:hypothetical protein
MGFNLMPDGAGHLTMGSQLSRKERRKLDGAPTADDIFTSMEDFNSEILDSHSEFIEGELPVEVEPEPVKPVKTRAISKPTGPKVKPVPERKKPEIRQPVKAEPKREEDLFDDLEELTQQIEQAEQAESQQTSNFGLTRERVMEALSKIQGAPTERQIAAWRQQYGEDGVHVTVLSEREIYVYTHLTRAQWTTIKGLMDRMSKVKENVSEDDLMLKVLGHVMLFPKIDETFKYQSRGGVLEALYTAIMAHSYFLNPQQVMALTMEL